MKRKLTIKTIIPFIVLVLFSVPSWAAIQLIAEPGRPADDFPPGFIYWGIDTGSSAIGPSGHIAFSGAADTSIGSTENNTNAVWSGLPGQLKAIIRENESPIGFPDNVLFDSAAPATNVGNIVVTRSGLVGFPALLKGAVQGKRALLAHVNGTTLGIIREDDPAPGFPPGTFVKSIANFSFSDAGMVIIAQVAGSSTPASLATWFYDFENITLLPSPVTGCTYLPSTAGINDSGEIVLTTLLIDTDGKDCSVPYGVFKWSNGNWEILLAETDSVPSMLDANFSFAGAIVPLVSPMINDQGDVAFSVVSRNSASFPQKGGMWTAEGSDDPKLLVLAEETLGGNPNHIITNSALAFFNTGFTNDGFSMVPVNITTGTTALMTGTPRNTQPYSSLNDTGESQLAVVAQQDDQPPGFEPTWFYSWFLGQALNRNGQFVFTGRVCNATANDEITAVWRGNGGARPRLKAVEGMKVTVNGEGRVLEQIFPLDTNRRNTTGKTFMTTGGKTAHFSDNGHFLFDGNLLGSPNGVFLIPDDSREQRIFTLAEQLFPQFFSPANTDDRLVEGFEYRFYPDTNTYIGIKDGEVFLLGDVFGAGVQRVDTIDNTLQLLENLIQSGF